MPEISPFAAEALVNLGLIAAVAPGDPPPVLPSDAPPALVLTAADASEFECVVAADAAAVASLPAAADGFRSLALTDEATGIRVALRLPPLAEDAAHGKP